MEALTQAFLWRCEHSRCGRARDSAWWLPVLLDDSSPTLAEAIGESIDCGDEPRWAAGVASASSDGAASNAFATFRYDCFLVFAAPRFLQRRAADGDKFAVLLLRAVEQHGLVAACRAGALGVAGLATAASGAGGDGEGLHHPHALTYAIPVVLAPRLSQRGVGESTSVPRSKVSVTTTPRTHWLPCIEQGLTRDARVQAIQAVLAQCDLELTGSVGVFASWHDIALLAPDRFGPRLRLSASRAPITITSAAAADATAPFTGAGLDSALRKCAAGAPGLDGACVIIEGTMVSSPSRQVTVGLRWAVPPPPEHGGCFLPDAADVCPLLVHTTIAGSSTEEESPGDAARAGWVPCPWHCLRLAGPDTLIITTADDGAAAAAALCKRHRAEDDSSRPPAESPSESNRGPTTLHVTAASLRYYAALPAHTAPTL